MNTHLRRGGNAVEFALTLPIFLSFVLGIADYGYMFHLQSGLDNSVAMACREGVKQDPGNGGDPVGIATTELTNRSALFCTSGCTLAVNDLSTGIWAVPNRTLECTATLTYNPVIGLLPHPATLSSASYQRLEFQRN